MLWGLEFLGKLMLRVFTGLCCNWSHVVCVFVLAGFWLENDYL